MGENIMAYIIILFIGGVIGWSLVAYTVVYMMRCRDKELNMIREISTELKKVREEINELK
jgi:hypothetical protein